MKRSLYKNAVALVMCLVMIFAASNLVIPVRASSSASGADITNSFTCPNFLALVRDITGIPYPTRIHASDVEWIGGLNCMDAPSPITSLNGIEHLISLTFLHMGWNVR